MKEIKSKPRKNLKKDSFQNLLDGTKIWAEYWRKNPHRFAVEYLQLNLYWFQMVLIYTMNICNIFCFIACRGEFSLPQYTEMFMSKNYSKSVKAKSYDMLIPR